MSKQPIPVTPKGGVTYEQAKKDSQELANDFNRPVDLYFNTPKNGKPERINPKK